jgi:hypothetical protein
MQEVRSGSIATERLLLGRTRSPLWFPKHPQARMLLALCNRTEEYGYAGASEYRPSTQASAVE